MRKTFARVVVAGLALTCLSGCTGSAGGYDGFQHPRGDGLNSPYEHTAKKVDHAKYTARPFNVTDQGFTTLPFHLEGQKSTYRKFSFLPVDSKKEGSALVAVVLNPNMDDSDSDNGFDLAEDVPEETVLTTEVGEPGDYQVKVSYPDPADITVKERGWEAVVQKVTVVRRGNVTAPSDPTLAAKDDGVTSAWDFTSKLLDESKYTTTPIRVTQSGYTSLPFPLGDADHTGEDQGDIEPMSFIPVDNTSRGTLLVTVERSADPEGDDLSDEENPEDSILPLYVPKPGYYQVQVRYPHDSRAHSGWEIEVQQVTDVATAPK